METYFNFNHYLSNMKTVTTKLDNDEFEEFLEICNDEGCSKSEMLRKLVKDFTKMNAQVVEEESEEEAVPELKITSIDGVPVKSD